MSTKKTIQINPELFKLPGNKTKKNKEKKELTLNPIITPNSLKNKLLNRIKEHKNKEINTKNKSKSNDNANDDNKYSDEFHGALNYLSDLTKKQKVNEVKQRMINARTIKNYQSISPNLSNLTASNLTTSPPIATNSISLDLPPELQETKTFVPQTNDVFNVNYKMTDDVPYGCLKNGRKKTYREWKQLTAPITTDIPDNIRPPTPPKKNVGMFLEGATNIETNKPTLTGNNLSREERLEQIKNKLKKMQDKETQIKQASLDNFKEIEKQFSTPLMDLTNFDTNETNMVEELLKEREQQTENEKTKHYLKKTFKRKFTLGKSDKLRRVSILTNNRQTRKNIIDTQKELKKTTMTDVKQYLRQHGMIKVGSTCPADILRKTFETAVLTGEVTNTNKDTLLHNYMLSDKE
jgi:hypothetical protein